MPVLRVGQFDCSNSLDSKYVSWSDSKALSLAPRRLWGDSDNEDEDSLPSPLPRLELQPVVSSVNQDAASSVESGSDEADKPAFFSDVAEAAAQNLLVLSAVAGTSAQKILASSAAAGSAAQSSAVPAENSTGCVSMTTKLGVLAGTADFKVDVSSAAVDWQSVELGRPQEDATSFFTSAT
jgi:hypothetical protein